MSSNETTQRLTWKVTRSEFADDSWAVEAVDAAAGLFYLVRFSGLGSGVRAHEYAAIKNAIPNPEQALAKAREALAFYANPNNYMVELHDVPDQPQEDCPIDNDMGKRAIKALALLGGAQ